jgi:hypothetical protein
MLKYENLMEGKKDREQRLTNGNFERWRKDTVRDILKRRRWIKEQVDTLHLGVYEPHSNSYKPMTFKTTDTVERCTILVEWDRTFGNCDEHDLNLDKAKTA